jgi:Fe-S-cluster-containing dehydrogenase component/CRP-like cAMP-binding protein
MKEFAMSGPSGIRRPRRWDMPFSDEIESERSLVDEDLERIINMRPFSWLEESAFSPSLPLREILRNDVRIKTYLPGDIIVREGDWGNSAFFILAGKVRVELEPLGSKFPPKMLGRREVHRKTLLQSIAQLWNRHPEPEFRRFGDDPQNELVARRGSGEETRIYLQDVSAVLDKYRTALLETGQWFGEIAALGRTQRVATVFAETDSELLEIRWQGLRDLMRNDVHGGLKLYIEEMFRERALASFLRNTEVFRHLERGQMEEIVARASFESYGSFDTASPYRSMKENAASSRIDEEPVIAEEGTHPYGIILIRSGVARLSERHHRGYRTVGYLTPGQAYGVEEVLTAWKTKADVSNRYRLTAIGYVNVVSVPTLLVEKLILDAGHAARLLEQVPAALTPSSETPVEENLLEFFVTGGYVQGTATMLIDLERCTRCDDCVRACAMTHDNNPRFIRHGPVHDRFMVATACMHCSDPVCMIECPTGAIHRTRSDGTVVINDQTCIGCTQCANNCPYDAIRMVPIRDRSGNPIVDEKTGNPLTQATKCDLCIDQWGPPACQTACPHDALQRIDMREIVELQSFVNR